MTASYPLINAYTSRRITPGTGWFYTDDFLMHRTHEQHPESYQRLLAITQRMQADRLWHELHHFQPDQPIYPHILKVHTPSHIDAIMHHHKRTGQVASRVVSAAVAATDKVCAGQLRNAFCASRPPGHHALNTGREEGFCYFNAVAVAARYAQAVHQVERILIIDWDYHHGNGTELAFYEEPGVLFFSTHNRYAYPGTGHPERTGSGKGRGYNINVHLGCGSTDAAIMAAFQHHLIPAAERFAPQLILISAGFDSRAGDRLGCFAVTDAGFRQLTRLVMALAAQYSESRIVSVLEGGYTPAGLANAVHAHVSGLLAD